MPKKSSPKIKTCKTAAKLLRLPPVQVLLVVQVTAVGFVIARLRLATGSVWPAVALHLAWNRIIIGGFDAVTTGTGAALWVGESGILTTLTLVVAAALCSRGRWTILRSPAARDQAQ